jgi:hypothetical protein
MAIKKSDVLSADSTHVRETVNEYEAQADTQLAANGHFDINLGQEKTRFQDVIGKELKKRYEKAGWQVSINSGSDQRDGNWYDVVIR